MYVPSLPFQRSFICFLNCSIFLHNSLTSSLLITPFLHTFFLLSLFTLYFFLPHSRTFIFILLINFIRLSFPNRRLINTHFMYILSILFPPYLLACFFLYVPLLFTPLLTSLFYTSPSLLYDVS